jgi:hypothetical protein
VCEGLGEDLGIPSNLLRISFALLLFMNPVVTIAAYLAAGLVVAFSRWMYPNPRPAEAADATPTPAPAEVSKLEELAANEQAELPLAA